MCKQYTMCYECGHKSYQRESSCNKHKTFHSSGHPACIGSSFLRIYLRGDCSVCQIAVIEEALEFNAEAMRIGMTCPPQDSEHNNTAETPDEWKMNELLAVYRRLPTQLKAKPARVPKAKTWQTRRKCKRTHSLLATEVTPETVVGHFAWETVDAGSQDIPLDNRQQQAWDATWDVEVPPPLDEADEDDIHEEDEYEFEEDDAEFEDNEAEDEIEVLEATDSDGLGHVTLDGSCNQWHRTQYENGTTAVADAAW